MYLPLFSTKRNPLKSKLGLIKSFVLIFLLAFAFASCEHDDEGDDDDDNYTGQSIVLNLNQCESALIFDQSEREEELLLAAEEIPTAIRAYISAELPGSRIITASSFSTNTGLEYTEVIVNNLDYLLFDKEGNFLCVTK